MKSTLRPATVCNGSRRKDDEFISWSIDRAEEADVGKQQAAQADARREAITAAIRLEGRF